MVNPLQSMRKTWTKTTQRLSDVFFTSEGCFFPTNRCTNLHGFCLDARFVWHVSRRRRRKAKPPNQGQSHSHCASIFTISYLFHRFVYLSFIPNLLIVLPSKKSFCIKVSSNNALRTPTKLVQMFVRPFYTKGTRTILPIRS